MTAVRIQSSTPVVALPGPSIHISKQQPTPSIQKLVACIFQWSIWSLLTALVAAQFGGIILSSSISHQHMLYGQSMVDNPHPTLETIPGQNDEPYTDRNFVCIAEGRSYVPRQLSEVLSDPALTKTVDTTGAAIHGYRVCRRPITVTVDSDAYEHYVYVCNRIAESLAALQDSCEAMGYNITRDMLHIVEDAAPNKFQSIPGALPVLVIPFWDNAMFAHYVIPGYDGVACDVRLVGRYEDSLQPNAVIRGVDKSVREAKTAQWVGVADGTWRNGWYEEPNGSNQRWYANFQSTKPENDLGILVRQFDGLKNVEYDCKSANPPDACAGIPATEWWGSKASVTENVDWYHQVAISNGTRFGVFTYEAQQTRTVEAKYTFETFISNASLSLILMRWLVSMLTLLNSYRRGVSSWQNAGLGCLSCARNFNLLPIALLPRLKFTMAAFWTVGCEFEGQQKALSEAWFAVYPNIAEFMLFYYSILNIVAKITHRRMSDVLFGPTLLFFCLMHYFRLDLAKSGWFSYDGRITTVVLSDEFDRLTIGGFLTSDVALRLNGNILELLVIKIVVLAISVLPLFFADNMTKSGQKYRSCPPCDVEKALALRASNVGGFGRSAVYEWDAGTRPPTNGKDGKTGRQDVKARVTAVPAAIRESIMRLDCNNMQQRPVSTSVERSSHALISYEVHRLGYVVFGGVYLISFEDWYTLASYAPLRIIDKLWNHRIIVFEVTKRSDGYYVSATAQLCRLDDERLLAIPWYDVVACPFR